MTNHTEKLPELLPTPLGARLILALSAAVLAVYTLALVAQASNVI